MRSRLLEQAAGLLRIIARSDVEDLSAHRERALEQLGVLERMAAEMGIPDFYQAVLDWEELRARA